MLGRTSGLAVSSTNTSKTTHVLDVGGPPGGSLPPGPFPKVGSPVLSRARTRARRRRWRRGRSRDVALGVLLRAREPKLFGSVGIEYGELVLVKRPPLAHR